jgi:REP element-mobilizing transposase RayT
MITPEVETLVYRAIEAQAQRLGCSVLAIGGMPDHVHLAVLFTPNITIADFVRQVKGAVSFRIRDHYKESRFFRWQPNYAVIGFRLSQAERVIEYVRDQKTHHAEHRTVLAWEETEVWEDGRLRRAGDVEAGRKL